MHCNKAAALNVKSVFTVAVHRRRPPGRAVLWFWCSRLEEVPQLSKLFAKDDASASRNAAAFSSTLSRARASGTRVAVRSLFQQVRNLAQRMECFQILDLSAGSIGAANSSQRKVVPVRPKSC